MITDKILEYLREQAESYKDAGLLAIEAEHYDVGSRLLDDQVLIIKLRDRIIKMIVEEEK